VLNLRSMNPAARDVLQMLINRQSYDVQGSQIEYPKRLKTLLVPWDDESLDGVILVREILGDGLVGESS
ncbi:hypothetical protein FRB99_001575, partial [Tulasnella sp. 403]